MDTKENIQATVRSWINKLDFDFQAVPGTEAAVDAGKTALENHIVSVITSMVVNLAAAWWSIKELWDFIKNRSLFKEIVSNVGSKKPSGKVTTSTATV